ncbi:MAG: acetyltransferase [Pseudomonadota bacterium]
MFPVRKSTFLGLLSISFFVANTLAAGVFVTALVVARLVPVAGWQRLCADWLTFVAETWIAINNLNQEWTQPTRVRVSGLDGLRRDGRYLLLSNHRSAVDIVVLQRVLNRRIPLLRFFIKRQLIWVPVLGLAWWALGFPFMRRHSRAFLDRHPEQAGADLRTAREACVRLADRPLTLVNFVEGTRWTPSKHQRQGGPYRHLLQPKAGGTAAAVAALGSQLDAVLDVTLHYPGGSPSLLDLFFGRVPEIVLQVQALPVPEPELATAYVEHANQREPFVRWLDGLWRGKDGVLAAHIDGGDGARDRDEEYSDAPAAGILVALTRTQAPVSSDEQASVAPARAAFARTAATR